MEISQLCSNFDRLTEPVYSAGNAMTLQFSIDEIFEDRGFLAVITAVPGVYLMR